jgi:hypothetical protein
MAIRWSQYSREAQRVALTGQVDKDYSLIKQKQNQGCVRADDATQNPSGQKLTPMMRFANGVIQFNKQAMG